MYARTLPELLDAIVAPRENVSNGGAVTISESAAHELVGRVLWEVRKHRFVRSVYRVELLCHMIDGSDDTGWEAETFTESDDLEPVSCPLGFLQEAHAVRSHVWRDRVWHHHEEALARAIETSR